MKLLSTAILMLMTYSLPAFGFGRTLELSCQHLLPIEKSYYARHVNYTKHQGNLDHRTIKQFIKKLDSSKIYLLKSDIDEITKDLKGFFKAARKKTANCQVLDKAHTLYLKRVKERVDFAKKYLGKKFKYNSKTKLTLDPDERKYAKTVGQANRFHKKYIQFQITNYISTDMPLAEAKETLIRSYERLYRRTKDFKKTDLYSMYLDAFAKSLDPHSSYLSKDQLEDFQIQMALSLEGIGATLSSKDGFTKIEQLIPGGAAFRSGKLKAKDKIIAVAQGEAGKSENVIEQDLRDVVRKIRGKKGTKVKLTILRKTGKTTKRFDVVLVRDKIKLEDDAASITYIDQKKDGKNYKVGLVNLPSFYADSRRKGRSAAKDLRKLFREARKKKVDSVVLDLSTNGGGSLDDAVKIAGLFFREGNVVKQSSRDPRRGEIALADHDSRVDYPGPLVVLVSEISASASEIVAGTLQDYKRAVIVGGKNTFGKGTVQSVEPLPKGLGALKTTVGMFFTAGGNSTQHRGVSSDIVFPSAYSAEEFGENTLDYSLPPKKIKPFLSAEAFVPTGRFAWAMLDKKMIKKLDSASQKRIAKSKDFKKIIDDVKKAKERGKSIVLSEFLKEQEDDDKKKEKNDEEGKSYKQLKAIRHKKYLERADVKEAVNIAVDLAEELKRQSKMIIGGKKKSPDNG